MLLHRIPVRRLMAQTVITIDPEASAVDAAQVMEEYGVRRLPVLDADDCLVGLVTATDILEADTAHRVLNSYEPGVQADWLTVGDIMTREVITIAPDASIGELAALMLAHKIDGVPVVEPHAQFPRREHLVGIITEVDIFRALAQAWQAEHTPGPDQFSEEPQLEP